MEIEGLKEYNKLEARFIRLFAKHFELVERKATKLWIEHGMAKHFAELYRETYHLPTEPKEAKND